MTREEFQKIVDEITGGEYIPAVRKNEAKGIKGSKASYGPTVKISKEWMTGGAWGGNCWDDSSPSSYCPEPDKEPEMDELDIIIEKVAPNMGFIQYKNLMKKVSYSSKTIHEYYGNHTSYGTKEILVEDIWEFLKERGYV